MALYQELLKRIVRKQNEIREYQDKIREASAYLQSLQDTLKLVPKEDASGVQEITLRHGSNAAKARDAIKAAAKPMHITEILKAIGQPTDKRHRLALAGSIAAYVRQGKIFSRPAPNTFGLLEFDEAVVELPDEESIPSGSTHIASK